MLDSLSLLAVFLSWERRAFCQAFAVTLLSLLCLLSATDPAAAQGEKARYKMGLVVGDRKEGRLDSEVLNVTTEAFVLSRRFIMVERKYLEELFAEKDIQAFLDKGNQKLSDVFELDLLGLVGYSVETKTSNGKSFTNFTIEVRLVDVKTGWILGTISSEHPDSHAPPSTHKEAARDLFQNIREMFPPFGYVVKVNGKEVIIDLGSDAGLEQGDILEVVKVGEQIIHPRTGEALPPEFVVISEIKVIDVSSRLATCWARWAGGVSLGSPVRIKEKHSALERWLGRGLPN